MARITKPNRMSSSCVEMVLSRRVSRHLAVLLADLVTQLVDVEDIENLSHFKSNYDEKVPDIRWSGRRETTPQVPIRRSNSPIDSGDPKVSQQYGSTCT